MAPTKQQGSNDFLQREILDKILEVKNKVDQSLQLGRENGEAIRSLRTELGVDGLHGRIPQLEQAVARLDRRQEDDHKELCAMIVAEAKKAHEDKNKLLDLIEPLKVDGHERHGRNNLLQVALSFVGGSAGAAVIGILAKMMGLIH